MRLTTPIGGATITGILFSFLPIVMQYLVKNKLFKISATIITLIGVLLTGSRTPIFALIISFLLTLKINKKFIFKVNSLLIITIIVICVFFTLNWNIERYLSFQTKRAYTQELVIDEIFDDPLSLLFGKGLGQYFPYTNWYKNTRLFNFENPMVENTFKSNSGNYILVDPHSLLYGYSVKWD